jgi:hypothetical protein
VQTQCFDLTQRSKELSHLDITHQVPDIGHVTVSILNALVYVVDAFMYVLYAIVHILDAGMYSNYFGFGSQNRSPLNRAISYVARS